MLKFLALTCLGSLVLTTPALSQRLDIAPGDYRFHMTYSSTDANDQRHRAEWKGIVRFIDGPMSSRAQGRTWDNEMLYRGSWFGVVPQLQFTYNPSTATLGWMWGAPSSARITLQRGSNGVLVGPITGNFIDRGEITLTPMSPPTRR